MMMTTAVWASAAFPPPQTALGMPNALLFAAGSHFVYTEALSIVTKPHFPTVFRFPIDEMCNFQVLNSGVGGS